MTILIKGRKPLVSIGIDPSTAATGIVILRESGQKTPELLRHQEYVPKSLSGLARAIDVTEAVMRIVHAYAIDRIVVEGYSLNLKNASSVIPLVELGTLLRFSLRLDGLRWYDPRATEVKKFATGKGTANKDQMILQVYKRWSFEAPSSNVADAYALAAMGLASAGRLPGITQEMMKITGAMAIRSN